MSVSKPFVFALVCEAIGAEAARAELGVNATGLPFNALEAMERAGDGRTNPMVNPGAIATTSLVPGANRAEKWQRIREGLSRFAGRDLTIDDEIYRCAIESNSRNQAIARLLETYGRLHADPVEAIDLYTMQCSLRVNAEDLAVMGATLADGGVNPLTKERVIDADTCRFALAVMATAGLYETSGDWLYQVGLPGKSGIAGGIVTVAPGKGGLGTFSPAARRHRQQRPRAARRALPVGATGLEPVRLERRDLATARNCRAGTRGGAEIDPMRAALNNTVFLLTNWYTIGMITACRWKTPTPPPPMIVSSP